MNIAEALSYGKQQLNTDSAALDAELLLCEAIERARTYLFTWPETPLTPEQTDRFKNLIEARSQGTPVAYLLGEKEFWGMTFEVTPDTLIPRPDTEILVEQALTKLATSAPTPPRVLDLGTGSGAIICALKSERPAIEAYAVDASPEALQVARRNAERLGLNIQFLQGDWFSPVDELTFDVIVSNPPYIVEQDPHLSQGDVRFEPLSALTSGKDGLDDIRSIVKQSSAHLKDSGWLLIEHGYHQAEDVAAIFQANGFHEVELFFDYGQNPRVTAGRK